MDVSDIADATRSTLRIERTVMHEKATMGKLEVLNVGRDKCGRRGR